MAPGLVVDGGGAAAHSVEKGSGIKTLLACCGASRQVLWRLALIGGAVASHAELQPELRGMKPGNRQPRRRAASPPQNGQANDGWRYDAP